MKVFIVFLGLFIVSACAIVYQGDLGAYNHEQLLIKEAAEECAAGAALLLDQEQFSKGSIVFNYEGGKSYTEDYLAYIKRNSKALSKGVVHYQIEFEDENKGFSPSNLEKIPAVTVKIQIATEDLFRVPFIKVTSLERSARYELPERKYKESFEKGDS